MTFIILTSIVALLWLIATFVFSGPNLSHFDSTLEESADDVFDSHLEDSEHDKKILSRLAQTRQKALQTKSISKALNVARAFADELSFDLVTDTQFKRQTANGVSCEWTIAPDVDTSQRIVFFHGGAFLFGSANGHRKFTDKLSRLANAAVLSVDYRMLLRHSRKAGIKDAQQAYLWALENGPNGHQALNFLAVAGDSAGGNLAHMISSWSAQNAPKKPDCLLSFSPSLDQIFSSPTIQRNLSTDKILGEGLRLLTLIPKPIRLWFLFLSMRMNPASPLASPLFADLSSLPPTLIHASSSEMLLGECIRYTNKARSQGAKVRLQVWKDQIHDWHLFNMGVGSADVAWNEVAKFITEQKTRLDLLPCPEPLLNKADQNAPSPKFRQTNQKNKEHSAVT